MIHKMFATQSEHLSREVLLDATRLQSVVQRAQLPLDEKAFNRCKDSVRILTEIMGEDNG